MKLATRQLFTVPYRIVSYRILSQFVERRLSRAERERGRRRREQMTVRSLVGKVVAISYWPALTFSRIAALRPSSKAA